MRDAGHMRIGSLCVGETDFIDILRARRDRLRWKRRTDADACRKWDCCLTEIAERFAALWENTSAQGPWSTHTAQDRAWSSSSVLASAKVNGRPVGGVETAKNHKIKDEMGREWTVWAENQPNRSVTALRTLWPGHFLLFSHPGPKKRGFSEKAKKIEKSKNSELSGSFG